MKIPEITQMTQDDINLTLIISNCGSNKTKHKNDIILLFKKYIDSTLHICTSCSLEIIMVWKKYLIYYNKYIETQNGKENN